MFHIKAQQKWFQGVTENLIWSDCYLFGYVKDLLFWRDKKDF